jgi:transposase
VPTLLDEAGGYLPGAFRELVLRMLDYLKDLDRQVGELEVQIKAWHRSNALSRKLEKIPGIGPITASALIASVGNAKNFKNGRQLAAWLGLVPRQHSTGGKSNLLGISKRGDSYPRRRPMVSANASSKYRKIYDWRYALCFMYTRRFRNK